MSEKPICVCCGGILPPFHESLDEYLVQDGECPGHLRMDDQGDVVGCGAWSAEAYSSSHTYTICDPFAGDIDISGETIEEAIEEAYTDVEPEERPTHVWYADTQYLVPGGLAKPLC
jgi:hypothetical protein